ncbi:MAG: HDOD domain-containing protein, partial [Planctomycetota bacterium]
MDSRLSTLLKEIDEVVTLPVVVQEVMNACRDPKSNAKGIAKIIANDPILTVKVMRTANSSLFGFLFKTKDLEAAVTRLGIKQIRSIAAAMGVGKLFAGGVGEAGYSRLAVWE